MNIDRPVMFQGNGQALHAQPALPAAEGRQPVQASGWNPDEYRASGRVPYACSGLVPENGNPYQERDAGQLSCSVPPECLLPPCSIDSSTMAISVSSRVYPIDAGTSGNFMQDARSYVSDAPPSASHCWTLVLIGSGLMALGLWKRKSSELPRPLITVLPVSSAIHIPDPLDKNREAKAPSLAA